MLVLVVIVPDAPVGPAGPAGPTAPFMVRCALSVPVTVSLFGVVEGVLAIRIL